VPSADSRMARRILVYTEQEKAGGGGASGLGEDE